MRGHHTQYTHFHFLVLEITRTVPSYAIGKPPDLVEKGQAGPRAARSGIRYGHPPDGGYPAYRHKTAAEAPTEAYSAYAAGSGRGGQRRRLALIRQIGLPAWTDPAGHVTKGSMRTTAKRRSVKKTSLTGLVTEVLKALGEDPKREGLEKTPDRVERSLRFLTGGYKKDARKVINGAVFEEQYDEMVLLRDIDIFSLCEHHLLPFYGKCHIAYIPKGKVIGLSKLPRIVEVFSRRLQIQERLTTQIADCLMENLRPYGVGVVIEALHLCMAMRGVEKQESVAVTSAMLGVFREDRGTRQEFLDLIRHARNH